MSQLRSNILLWIFAAVFILPACHDSHDNHENHENAESHHHEVPATLTLNNGQKWTADTATTVNVAHLSALADSFSTIAQPSLADYNQLGIGLNKATNKMISECRMQGADHDALHVWLEPVIQEVNDLKSVADTANAKKIFISLQQRMQAYGQYFEQGNK